MELNKQSVGRKFYFETGQAGPPLRKSTSSDYFFTPAEVLHNSRNFILILSQDGRLKNMSTSLFKVLGYSEDELLAGPVNNMLTKGKFITAAPNHQYYFDSTMRCKSGAEKAITWRLVPDLLINAYVYVGWETRKK